MTAEQQGYLLDDLIKLVKKHGAESVEDFARLINSSESASTFAKLLTEVARQGKVGKSGPKIKPRLSKSKRDEYGSANFASEEHRELFRHFEEDLRVRRLLPSLGQVRDFLFQSSISGLSREVHSRDKAIRQILDAAVFMSSEELRHIYSLAQECSLPKKSSLEAWSDIILKRPRAIGE